MFADVDSLTNMFVDVIVELIYRKLILKHCKFTVFEYIFFFVKKDTILAGPFLSSFNTALARHTRDALTFIEYSCC